MEDAFVRLVEAEDVTEPSTARDAQPKSGKQVA
jgi:hypothetical protein